jgi:hypothetical protein
MAGMTRSLVLKSHSEVGLRGGLFANVQPAQIPTRYLPLFGQAKSNIKNSIEPNGRQAIGFNHVFRWLLVIHEIE